MGSDTIRKRIEELRSLMKKDGISYYYVTTADYHNSEYVDDHFKEREFLSGFTGSNGNLLIGEKKAGLWTDGRYFLQAGQELEGTGITLFRQGEEGVPTVEEFLGEELKEGQLLAFDGRRVSVREGKKLEKAILDKGGVLNYQTDYSSRIWKERPARKANPIFLLSEEVCGKSVSEKLEEVRQELRALDCDALVLSKLDDIMWLFNIRGSDVECNPVALSYSIITSDGCCLFLQKEALGEDERRELVSRQIEILEYDSFEKELGRRIRGKKVLLDDANSNFSIYKAAKEHGAILLSDNPTQLAKAKKNETELARIRRAYEKDSLAVCRFMRWLKENVGKISMTELSAGAYMDELRRKTEGFLDLSFPTICGYGENGAIVHYQADENSCKVIEPRGMLLVDSGGQYLEGTTDVTRTYALGEVTGEMKLHFTLVAMGMLRLLNAKFLYGCTGRNLDILARLPLWERGLDYKHGTGHGIGYILNVHEGPQSLRWQWVPQGKETILEEGMLLSNEPGIYIGDSHGIRIENIMAVRKGIKNSEGQFMEFEGLTYAPIDLELIDPSVMEQRDIDNLNRYHRQVYEKMAPLMTKEEVVWLKKVTSPIK